MVLLRVLDGLGELQRCRVIGRTEQEYAMGRVSEAVIRCDQSLDEVRSAYVARMSGRAQLRGGRCREKQTG